jgi:hypothetical protein
MFQNCEMFRSSSGELRKSKEFEQRQFVDFFSGYETFLSNYANGIATRFLATNSHGLLFFRFSLPASGQEHAAVCPLLTPPLPLPLTATSPRPFLSP